MTVPTISVLMPVYNGEAFIKEAIDSILSQTWKDFECIIIDDGSTDTTGSIIKSYDDPRIKLLHNNHNYIESLNIGLKAAQGKYIARMDADDIMYPERLTSQYDLMEKNQNITVCGSWFTCFGINHGKTRIPAGDIDNPLALLLSGNILAHPTAMLRNSFLKKHNLHYENYPYAEDYKLWSEIAKAGGKFYIIPEYLLKYRSHASQVTKTKYIESYQTSINIKNEILEHLIINSPHQDELVKLYDYLSDLHDRNIITITNVFNIFHELFKHPTPTQ